MLSIIQGRILGCLLEKQRTVPDQYPLTLNATVAACNQSSNREPVMAVEEHEVQHELGELKGLGFVRFVHPTSGRGVTKFRQVLDERLGLEPEQAAVLAVLLLRGPQTPGELRTRCERLHPFESVEAVERTLRVLGELAEPLVRRFERQPGQSAQRWQQLVAEEDAEHVAAALAGGAGAVSGAARGSTAQELAELKARVDQLETRLAHLESLLD